MLTILVGQAGNQVGGDFWRLLADECEQAGSSYVQSSFLHPDGFARCICIDSEPKVISGMDAGVRRLVRPGNTVTDASGRGNNWAMGFWGTHRQRPSSQSPIRLGVPQTSFLEQSLETVRKEWERLDWNRGCLMVHSMSGGTGSGFGARLLAELRDAYPRDFLVTASISPLGHGENTLQHYNAVLCARVLQECADATLLFSNEDLLRHLSKDLAPERMPVAFRGAYARLSMADVNAQIAASLAGLTLPLGRGSPSSLWDLVSHLAPDPRRKFLSTVSAPVLTARDKMQSFEYLSQQVCNLAPRFDGAQRPIYSLATSVIVRGDSAGRFMADHKTVCGAKLAETFRPYSYGESSSGASKRSSSGRNVADMFDWRVSREPPLMSRAKEVPTSMTVCSNRSSNVYWMLDMCCKARRMFRSRAYLHWYAQYGVDADEMEEAFGLLEDTAYGYMM
jgi:hypothetical protein